MTAQDVQFISKEVGEGDPLYREAVNLRLYIGKPQSIYYSSLFIECLQAVEMCLYVIIHKDNH